MKEGWARSWVRAGLLNRKKKAAATEAARSSKTPKKFLSAHPLNHPQVLNFVYFYLVGSRYCKETNSLISDSIGVSFSIQLSNPRIILH
ncbi:hypothetical protein NC651_013267 [Populus alba x Populus x berolinensis]|nr:hypothetical protein NC651_013267 [Populus alba x Populus x berolinensis]